MLFSHLNTEFSALLLTSFETFSKTQRITTYAEWSSYCLTQMSIKRVRLIDEAVYFMKRAEHKFGCEMKPFRGKRVNNYIKYKYDKINIQYK